MTWTQVAYKCNYFDQMHLIRDFNEFANANPKRYQMPLKSSLLLLDYVYFVEHKTIVL